MDPAAMLMGALEAKGLLNNRRKLRRNAFLGQAGEVCKEVFLIINGCVRAFVMDGEEENTIRFGYKGSFLASLDSFLRDEPSIFYLQAIRQSEVLVIGKQDFLDVVNDNQAHLRWWSELLGQLVVQQLEREVDLLTSSPAERYQRVLKRSPQLFQEVPNKYIASYLRMAPETLSRLKSLT